MKAVELSAKAVQGPALPLQSIDHIHSGHSLPLGMLGVGDSVSDDILQEDLKDGITTTTRQLSIP